MTRTSLAWSRYVGWLSSRCMALTGVACSQFRIQDMATCHSGCVPVKAKLCCQCPSALPTSVITQGQRLHNKATMKLDQAFRTMFILLSQEGCAVLVINGCCSYHVPSQIQLVLNCVGSVVASKVAVKVIISCITT